MSIRPTRRHIPAPSIAHFVVSGMSCLLVALLLTSQARAADYNRVVNVGDQGAAWTDLPGIDGSNHSLEGLADKKAVVVVFTCNHCPVAMAYQERIAALAKDYDAQGVALVAINVNNGEDLDSMKQFAAEKGIEYTYVRDESQESARSYGATCTPHVFLLDKDRKIAYMGAIDDNWQDATAVETPYLRNAIDAVLAGHSPEVSEAKQIGCAIRWKN